MLHSSHFSITHTQGYSMVCKSTSSFWACRLFNWKKSLGMRRKSFHELSGPASPSITSFETPNERWWYREESVRRRSLSTVVAVRPPCVHPGVRDSAQALRADLSTFSSREHQQGAAFYLVKTRFFFSPLFWQGELCLDNALGHRVWLLGMVLSRTRTWIWWSMWVPSTSAYSVILQLYFKW